MKNIKPFGPTIGKTKISKGFFNKLNKVFDSKSNSKKVDYSSKLASQIKNEIKISNNFIKKNLEKEIKAYINKFLLKENIKNIKNAKNMIKNFSEKLRYLNIILFILTILTFFRHTKIKSCNYAQNCIK